MMQFFKSSTKEAMNFLRYVGPGLLVTVGFIDPGNWASNIAAGSGYGYTLLWMVTLSTIMLIILQHNAAHLGIVTGKCLSEATSLYINKGFKDIILLTAVAASIATAMAELLGGAMALEMLFHNSSKDWYIYHFRDRTDLSVYECIQQNRETDHLICITDRILFSV